MNGLVVVVPEEEDAGLMPMQQTVVAVAALAAAYALRVDQPGDAPKHVKVLHVVRVSLDFEGSPLLVQAMGSH